MKKTQNNYRRVQILIGSLGMILPLILPIFHGYVSQMTNKPLPIFLPSISHYNYSFASVIFTGVLIAFGLLLMSYKGYREESFFFRDDTVTSFSGGFAIVVALIPTAFDCTLLRTPNAHEHSWLSFVHLACAGIFLILLGIMSAYKFTKGETKDIWHNRRKRAYRILGFITIASILTLAVLFAFGKIDGYTVIIFETIALFSFGFSWLLKGKASFFVALGLISKEELEKARLG